LRDQERQEIEEDPFPTHLNFQRVPTELWVSI